MLIMFDCVKRAGLAVLAGVTVMTAAVNTASARDIGNVTMFGADTAFILPHGAMFIGGTLSDPRGGVAGNDMDGDIAFGAGFLSPTDSIGLEVDVNITGTDPMFDSGALTFKASRALSLQPNSAIFGSVAVSNVAAWGDAKLADERWNATISGMTQIAGPSITHPIMWTVGYGSDAVLRTPGRSLVDSGVFAGVGIGVNKYFGVSVSGTENQMNAGIGISIPGLDGVGISYGVNDITDHMERRQQLLSITFTKLNVFKGY
jgi:hypothetical protein